MDDKEIRLRCLEAAVKICISKAEQARIEGCGLVDYPDVQKDIIPMTEHLIKWINDSI